MNVIFRSLLDIFSNRHKFYCPSTKIGRTCTGFNFASIDENDVSGFQELANDLQFDDRSKISKHCYFIINKIEMNAEIWSVNSQLLISEKAHCK